MHRFAPKAEDHPALHVAIVMDGNGRWATGRGLPRTLGHRKGIDAVQRTIDAAIALDVGYLTLFGFSTENWRRPILEVGELMKLLRFFLRGELKALHRKGVRLRFIGDRARLAPDIVDLLVESETLTEGNTQLNLTVALSYGGRQEITEAARRVARDVAAGTLAPEAIDEALFAGRLFTADLPDPDLLIRTSGEQRISNFLLWQAAYAELVFVDTLWPDFGHAELEAALTEFRSRERRYGAVGGQ
ncbi:MULTISPECIES: polyprenyl diphosphate synthase [Inquilinus]|uniref:Isoprenyl transferase n=1 Tax=Inquilinus ginsengisoli TaxID=363840 RepID=A0ABU1JRT7_9PROT|nr:polyprenyl diphosphate synthase [Inquilinus ginsengisoli]MDR6291335.1 undecaprenyl diphosphate synthase [Inquilinus ginsengisoli]